MSKTSSKLSKDPFRKLAFNLRLNSNINHNRKLDKAIMKILNKEFELKNIGGYFPIKGEVNLLPLLDQLNSNGHEISLPIIKDNNLKFVKTDLNNLIIGQFNIPIPPEIHAITQPDIILVPMLSFNSSGYRLGYGGGFYDRYIGANPRKIYIGIGYSWQKNENIPLNYLDKKLSYIVDELGLTSY